MEATKVLKINVESASESMIHSAGSRMESPHWTEIDPRHVQVVERWMKLVLVR